MFPVALTPTLVAQALADEMYFQVVNGTVPVLPACNPAPFILA